MGTRPVLLCLLCLPILLAACQKKVPPQAAARPAPPPMTAAPAGPADASTARSPTPQATAAAPGRAAPGDSLDRTPASLPPKGQAAGVPAPAASQTPAQVASRTPTPPQVTQPPAATAAAPPPAGKPGSSGITLQRQPTPASPGFSSSETLVGIGRGPALLPEDFKIGPLGDDRGGREDQDRAMKAAGAFLSDLAEGTVNPDLLTPSSRDAMRERLSFGLHRGWVPDSFRLGQPRTREDGEVAVAVRLFRKGGSSEGEIFVARSGSAWLVDDLQLSLEQLSVKREAPREKFFPLQYRWLLED